MVVLELSGRCTHSEGRARGTAQGLAWRVGVGHSWCAMLMGLGWLLEPCRASEECCGLTSEEGPLDGRRPSRVWQWLEGKLRKRVLWLDVWLCAHK